MQPNNVILTISCPDRVGLISAVSGFLAEHKAFIHESAQYGDPESKIFFMRCVFSLNKGESRTQLESKFTPFAKNLKMTWRMHDAGAKPKVVILVSKHGHCLSDLLHRYHSGTLPIEIPAVISNHPDFKSWVEFHKIPFHLVPADKNKKHEAQIEKILEEAQPDLVVLARYMQILSPALSKKLAGRCINIHHSFLPSFKGAKPYAQAFTRGVKLIGATAHYVTDDLDEGPIIDQAVERVDHTYGPSELAAVGRDIENIVLSRAVRYHVEHRILLNKNKTVVFR